MTIQMSDASTTDQPKPPAIYLRDLSFAWPGNDPCLVIDTFSLEAGKRLFVHGPSGCGKSSLLGLLTGVIQPQRGEIKVLGQSLGEMSPKQRDKFRGESMGYLFQQFNLLPYLSAYENISLPAQLFESRMRRALADGLSLEAEIGRLSESLDLSQDTLRKPAHQLSVGQQQRVAAARALLGAPPLIIADEPTSALDTGTQQRFMRLLLVGAKANKTTLIMVSHDRRLSHEFDATLRLPDINRLKKFVGEPS
jgi:putative ABC transport system ATP-binding protein